VHREQRLMILVVNDCIPRVGALNRHGVAFQTHDGSALPCTRSCSIF
jgi:hypothetical protein